MNPHRSRPSRAKSKAIGPGFKRKGARSKPFVPRADHPRCTGGGNKLRYKSRESAEHILCQVMLHGSGKQVAYRVYECPTCKGWHLSSKPAPPRGH